MVNIRDCIREIFEVSIDTAEASTRTAGVVVMIGRMYPDRVMKVFNKVIWVDFIQCSE